MATVWRDEPGRSRLEAVRIVSLCPSLTELVFQLGRGSDLVGITRFCVHPEDGVAGIARFGGTKNPDVDAILRVRPDLVLMNREENRRADFEALTQGGLICHQSHPKTPAEAEALVRELGQVLDRKERAGVLAGAIALARKRADQARVGRTPVRFAYLVWRRPYMTVNADTYVSALLTEAGGENVFGGHANHYPTIEPRDLRAASPGRIFLSSEPFPFKPKHLRELGEVHGIDAGACELVDGELLSWHGSRTAPGLDYALSLFSASARSR
jgi:ABC-type Fe3+-hydroxamate transport system substrate-binding protein